MQPGMHDRLLELLADALACHGCTTTRHAALEGRSGTVYTVPLLAEGPLGAIILDVQSDDPLPAAAVADMADVLHDVGADAALLCHLGAVEPGAHADGVSLWGLDHLVHFIGDALVADATSTTPQPLSLDSAPPPTREVLAESLSELLPAAFLEPAQPPAVEAPVSFDLDALEQMPGLDALDAFSAPAPRRHPEVGGPRTAPASGWATAAPGWTRPPAVPGAAWAPPESASDALQHSMEAAPPSPMPPHAMERLRQDTAAPIEPAPRHAHPLLPIRVTAEEAKMHTRRIMQADTVQMVLQPVHLIDYECDLLVEGSLRYDTIAGRVQVHGTDKTVTEVDPLAVDPQGFTRSPELPRMPGHERTLRVSDERAGERAAAHLLDAHTRIVGIEVDDPDSGYSYTEKKKVAPRPDHIRLNPLGVFHRVIWRLTGPGGHIDLDALTGEVVEEVLHNPRHDTLVID